MKYSVRDAIRYLGDDGFGEQVFRHFIDAMQAGYAKSPSKGTIKEMPGSKTIEYEKDGFRLLDAYLVTPQSSFSGGMTTEWFHDIPVWMMQYFGSYDDDAIPCLKAALKMNYEQRLFFGGRGPEFFTLDGYTYVNNVTENDFFGRSSGEERIFGPTGKLAGWHRHQSLYLVRNPNWKPYRF